MASHIPKSNSLQQLEQDLIKQEWALLCARRTSEVQQSEIEYQLEILRYAKEYRGL